MKLQSVLIIFSISISNLLFGQLEKADTTFLLKENSNGIYHTIFIEKNKTSKYYKEVSDFNFYNYEQGSYNSSLQYLKDKKIWLTQKTINQVPKKWISLYQYKNKFYLYYPCDFYFHFKFNITDTAFIDYTGEGPVANKILDFKYINHFTFQFRLAGMTKPKRSLTIHIIDRNKDIAVFEETAVFEGSAQEKRYYLMVSADKIKNFPIIVNYCPSQKEDEFQFDKPNYYKLLKTK